MFKSFLFLKNVIKEEKKDTKELCVCVVGECVWLIILPDIYTFI